LRDIKGVGPAREKYLLERFGSVSGVKKASFDELREAGIDSRTAREILSSLE